MFSHSSAAFIFCSSTLASSAITAISASPSCHSLSRLASAAASASSARRFCSASARAAASASSGFFNNPFNSESGSLGSLFFSSRIRSISSRDMSGSVCGSAGVGAAALLSLGGVAGGVWARAAASLDRGKVYFLRTSFTRSLYLRLGFSRFQLSTILCTLFSLLYSSRSL